MSDTYEPRLLPLDAWHRARGARMVPFAGHVMPLQYESIIAEHRWTRESASLFDVSHMGQVLLVGDGLDAAVEALLPIDLASLPVGGLRYSLLLDDFGGIVDDLILTRWSTGLFVVVNGANRESDCAWLRERLPATVALRLLEDRALLALQGPRAAESLAPLVEGARALADLAFMEGAAFMLDGTDLWISRSGYTGEDGFEIALPVSAAASVAERLCAQSQVRPAGLGARDSLRLEAGLPLHGHDIARATGPVEAGLAFAIARRRRAEGGFAGADPVLEALAEGPGRRRVGLRIEGRLAAREGDAVLSGHEPVGKVTSGGFSPTLGQPIAMAYVAASHASPDTTLTVVVRDRAVHAHVVPLPFVPHRYHRKGAR